MILTTTRATRPLNADQPRNGSTGSWSAPPASPERPFEAALLGSYACECTGSTLLQVQRTDDFDAPVQLVLTCLRDGARPTLAYRRMPWIVEEYMKAGRELTCDECGEVVAWLETFDGLVVGIEIACPLCGVEHQIDLTLSAIPPQLSHAAFGIEPPRAMLSPPVYEVLRMMWACIQRQPANAFSFTPYTIREDSGILRHIATGADLEVPVEHLAQLLIAGLIEDGDTIAISKPGVIVCLREFGQR